jgi:hypothetical protein
VRLANRPGLLLPQRHDWLMAAVDKRLPKILLMDEPFSALDVLTAETLPRSKSRLRRPHSRLAGASQMLRRSALRRPARRHSFLKVVRRRLRVATALLWAQCRSGKIVIRQRRRQ